MVIRLNVCTETKIKASLVGLPSSWWTWVKRGLCAGNTNRSPQIHHFCTGPSQDFATVLGSITNKPDIRLWLWFWHFWLYGSTTHFVLLQDVATVYLNINCWVWYYDHRQVLKQCALGSGITKVLIWKLGQLLHSSPSTCVPETKRNGYANHEFLGTLWCILSIKSFKTQKRHNLLP